MKKVIIFSKAFLLILICTVFIALFSYGGAIAMETVFPKEFSYPPGTMIASVEIEDLTTEEAKEQLSGKIANWKSETSIKLFYFDEIVEIDSTEVEFLITESLQLAQKGYSDLYTNLSEDIVVRAIEAFSYPIPIAELDQEAIAERINSHAMTLTTIPLYIDINEYIDTKAKEEKVVATAQLANLEKTLLLPEWSSKLDGFIIEAEETFSLVEAMETVGTVSSEGEALNALATVLYQLFLETNFQIVERHSGLTLPSYTEVGMNAVILEQNADFVVRNENYYPYTLKLSFQNNELNASLIGLAFPYQYTAITKNNLVIEPRKIVRFSATRQVGDKQVIRNGEKGHFAEVYRQVRNPQTDQLLYEQLLFEDFYPAIHQVEEWSLKEKPAEEYGFDENGENTGSESGNESSDSSYEQDEPRNANQPESPQSPHGESSGETENEMAETDDDNDEQDGSRNTNPPNNPENPWGTNRGY